MREIIKSIILAIRGLLLTIISLFLSKAKHVFVKEGVNSILIIRVDGIGDMILSIPAVKALRQQFPEARITVMTTETTKDLLQEAMYVDEMIVYRKGMDLKTLNYDLAIDLLDNYALKTALISYAVNAKYRAGFDIAKRGVFFNVKAPAPDKDKHYADAMLDLVGLLGAESDDRTLELDIASSAREEAVEFLRSHDIHGDDKIICIHPGAKNWTGRWLPERFAQVADQVMEKEIGRVVFVGAQYDGALIDQIKAELQGEAVFYIGHPLPNVAALIQQSDLLVCNNSGLLHVACALKTPTVSTMGPTLSKKWWPVGEQNIVLRQDLPCIGCGKGYCKIRTHECMQKITVEDMVEAIQKQLARNA